MRTSGAKYRFVDATDHDATEAMLTYGGAFVQRLGDAYRHADSENKARLKIAFADYFAQYRRIAEVKARQTRQVQA